MPKSEASGENGKMGTSGLGKQVTCSGSSRFDLRRRFDGWHYPSKIAQERFSRGQTTGSKARNDMEICAEIVGEIVGEMSGP